MPLAKEIFDGWHGYIRNHIHKVYPDQRLNFDVLTMFWYADLLHLQSTEKLLNGDAGKVIRADELKFMSKVTNRYYLVAESGSDLLEESLSPWSVGLKKSKIATTKLIVLVPRNATKKWSTIVGNFESNNRAYKPLYWVNNHIKNKPESEFQEISELWFANLNEAEKAVSNWHRELSGIIILYVSPCPSVSLEKQC